MPTRRLSKRWSRRNTSNSARKLRGRHLSVGQADYQPVPGPGADGHAPYEAGRLWPSGRGVLPEAASLAQAAEGDHRPIRELCQGAIMSETKNPLTDEVKALMSAEKVEASPPWVSSARGCASSPTRSWIPTRATGMMNSPRGQSSAASSRRRSIVPISAERRSRGPRTRSVARSGKPEFRRHRRHPRGPRFVAPSADAAEAEPQRGNEIEVYKYPLWATASSARRNTTTSKAASPRTAPRCWSSPRRRLSPTRMTRCCGFCAPRRSAVSHRGFDHG